MYNYEPDVVKLSNFKIDPNEDYVFSFEFNDSLAFDTMHAWFVQISNTLKQLSLKNSCFCISSPNTYKFKLFKLTDDGDIVPADVDKRWELKLKDDK